MKTEKPRLVRALLRILWLITIGPVAAVALLVICIAIILHVLCDVLLWLTGSITEDIPITRDVIDVVESILRKWNSICGVRFAPPVQIT